MTDATPLPADLEPGGTFFLFGDDEFRKSEMARALVDHHLDPSTRDFNYDRLRGSEVDVETLASLIGTPPMMAEWRVVHVVGAEALAQSARARSLLVETAEKPPPDLALVLVASIPSSSSARFYKDLKRLGRAMDFPQISENDAPGWLMERARDRFEIEMAEEAARALATAVGTDLGILAQELEKLAGMVEKGGTISLVEVEAAGTRLPKQDRWGWFDLVGSRRFDDALEGLPVLLQQPGESGVGLVIGLGSHLLRLGAAADGGRSGVEALLPRRLRGWLGPKLVRQADGWTVEEIEAGLSGLLRADRLLKGGARSEQTVLEEWLLQRMCPTASDSERIPSETGVPAGVAG